MCIHKNHEKCVNIMPVPEINAKGGTFLFFGTLSTLQMCWCYINLILLEFLGDLGSILLNVYAKFQNNWCINSGNMV